MSAFGRRGGAGTSGGGRPSFGVARPMKGSGGPAPSPVPLEGGDQFPPLDNMEFGGPAEDFAAPGVRSDAMPRLAERQSASSGAPTSRNEGFEASIHKIKE